jgi:hypothetical protein
MGVYTYIILGFYKTSGQMMRLCAYDACLFIHE